MRNEMPTAGPACGTDCESTMKIPEPTVSPTPNIVSRKTPRLRCNWSDAPSATGAPLTGRRRSICRCRLGAGVGMVPPEHLWSPRRDGGPLSPTGAPRHARRDELAGLDQDIPARGRDGCQTGLPDTSSAALGVDVIVGTDGPGGASDTSDSGIHESR